MASNGEYGRRKELQSESLSEKLIEIVPTFGFVAGSAGYSTGS